MNFELILRLVLDFIIILIGLYFIFWKSYLSEKGKNLATKKDIEEITKKIETVKNEIGIYSQLRLSYLKDRKKSALEFLSSISVWVDFTLRPGSSIYNNLEDIKKLSDLIIDLKNKGAIATSNYWNIFIYYEDENFIEISGKLYRSCVDLHNLTNAMLLNIEKKAKEIDYKKEIFVLVKDSKQKEQINLEIKDFAKKRNKFFSNYIKEREEIDKKISTYRMEYITVLNILLKNKTPSP